MIRNHPSHGVRAPARKRGDEPPEAQGVLRALGHGLEGVVFDYRRLADGRHRMASVVGDSQALCGLAPPDIVASMDGLLACIVPTDLPACMLQAPVQPVQEQAPPAAVFRLRHAQTGELRWLRARLEAPRGETDETAWRGHAIDITERKRLEVALEAAHAAALDAARTKSEFLANMSHEIRTPLNAILGLSHLVLAAGLTPPQHEHVEKILGAAQALLTLVNGILDLARLGTGTPAVERVAFDLLDVLDTLAGPCGVQARAKGLEFTVSTSDGLPYLLTGDPQGLGEVLRQLAGNAVKFTAQGRVVVDVSEVPEAQAQGATRLRFAVTDTGIGLPAEQLGQVFQAFHQVDAGRTRRYGGTGLGLAIARQLVERMGGEIGVESTPGQGATFWFTVPVGLPAERPASPPGAAAPAAPGMGAESGEPPDGLAFNREAGLDRVRNEDTFERLCEQFFAQNHPRLAELPGLVTQGALREAGMLTHALAGAAGLLGFERFTWATRQFERQIRRGEVGADELAGVVRAFAEAEEAFREKTTGAAALAPGTPSATGELNPLLDELRQQIEDFDIQAFDTYRHLRRRLSGGQRVLMAQLEAQLKEFDFAAAGASLAHLRAELAL